VTAELNRQDLTVHLLIHPIVEVVRDAEGTLVELLPPGSGRADAILESVMHIEVDEQGLGSAHDAIREGLQKVLADVRVAVTDWKKMRGKIIEAVAALDDETTGIPEHEVDEARVFLNWLDEDNFTFLGYREYVTVGSGDEAHMTVAPDSGLGILRDPSVHLFEGVRRLADLPPEVREHLQARQLLIVNKANLRSTVHRAVYLDAIGVKRFDKEGRVFGERLFAGLFTSTVYSRSPRFIPLLRRKTDRSWREKIEKEVRKWWDVLEHRAMNEAEPINPQRVFWELSPRLPDRCILTADSGSSANWWARDLRIRRGMMASLSGNLATMGPGVPYAIAAKFAHPDRPVVACVGDGAMQMSGINGLISIAAYWTRWQDPRLIILVLNNRDLNQVTWEQRVLAGDPRFEASQEVPAMSYARFAEQLGLRGVLMEKPEDIIPGWEAALAADRPVVVDAHTDPEVPPLPPHITLKQARNFIASIVKGDARRWRMIKRSARDAVESYVPGRGRAEE